MWISLTTNRLNESGVNQWKQGLYASWACCIKLANPLDGWTNPLSMGNLRWHNEDGWNQGRLWSYRHRLDNILAHLGSALIESTLGFICDLVKALYSPKISKSAHRHKPGVMTRVIKGSHALGNKYRKNGYHLLSMHLGQISSQDTKKEDNLTGKANAIIL